MNDRDADDLLREARRVLEVEADAVRALVPRLGPDFVALGADTAAHGDFNRDGLADLAFCSPKGSPQGREDAGVVHVLRGRAGGWPEVIDTAALPPPEEVQVAEIQGANGASQFDSGDIL